MYNPKHNQVISDVILEKMRKVGPPRFSKEEQEFAKEINKTLPPNSMEGYKKLIPPNLMKMAMQVLSQPLCPIIFPDLGKNQVMPGSTDVGDVSWVTPLGEFVTACHSMGSPGHSWQNVATAGMGIGHKGMLMAAKVLALTAIEFMNNPELVEKARKEFEEMIKTNTYKSPFPEGYKIPLHRFVKKK